MGVAIDKAGTDHTALGVNDLCRAVPNTADSRNFSLGDGHVGLKTGQARAVNNRSVANQQVVVHPSLLVCAAEA